MLGRLKMAQLAGLLSMVIMLMVPLSVCAQDIALTLTHRTVQVGNDGVTRTTEFRERFLRQGTSVWTERILPKPMASDHAENGHVGHRHFNLARSASWVQSAAPNGVKLQLVDSQDRVLVDVDRSNYADVGFEGSWEKAYFLIDPRALKTMNNEGAGPVPGTHWYSSARSGARLRILWDESRRLPREVHSETMDGRQRRSMVASIETMPVTPPWVRTDTYERKGYNDFLD